LERAFLKNLNPALVLNKCFKSPFLTDLVVGYGAHAPEIVGSPAQGFETEPLTFWLLQRMHVSIIPQLSCELIGYPLRFIQVELKLRGEVLRNNIIFGQLGYEFLNLT
jgi:hypothetical protein